MINNNTLRVTGLASGMNTDEIVANLVKVQSSRLNKMQQSKTWNSWKYDAYRDVNKKVDDFRKAMEGLRLQSSFNKKIATSSDTKVEVVTDSTGTQTNFTLSVVKLASDAKPAVLSFASGSQNLDSDLTFTLNAKQINLTSGMSVDEAVEEINKVSSETKVKASNVGGSLVFTSTDITQSIDLVGTTDLNNSWGITDRSTQATPASTGSVKINGTEVVISSNQFTYDGVTFKLNGVPTSDVTVEIGSDILGIFDSIKTFVDKYNELITDLNGRLTEKRYRDYPPLLDDQKKDMKDNDIKLWEEKAKSGLLTNDSTIQSLLTEMRSSISSVVQPQDPTKPLVFNSLKDIGIDFSNIYQEKGKLILNEDKLKSILKTNLEDVKALFTIKGTGAKNNSTTVTDNTMHEQSGFAWRIYDRLKASVKALSSMAGSPDYPVDTQSTIAKQLKSLDSDIYNEQDKVNAYEQRLWRQFGAMEKALQQLNSQSAWLSQQLGG